jgi:methionine aminopeptidase
LNKAGYTDFWYPTLVNAGKNTSKLFSRRIHLPSEEKIIQDNDIIIIDSTPFKDTVWANWCTTISIGNYPFYNRLIQDCRKTLQDISLFAKEKAKTIENIMVFGKGCINNYNLSLVGDNLGHSIFQVNSGQDVGNTPKEERMFIDSDHANYRLKNLILSIEPQLNVSIYTMENVTAKNFKR